MQGLIISMLLCLISSSISAMDMVKIPDRQELKRRFEAIDMEHFAERSTILDKLSGKETGSAGVAMAVELSIDYYFNDLQSSGMPEPILILNKVLINDRKHEIFDVLLKDYSSALKQLQKAGIYKRKSNL